MLAEVRQDRKTRAHSMRFVKKRERERERGCGQREVKSRPATIYLTTGVHVQVASDEFPASIDEKSLFVVYYRIPFPS